MRNVLLGYYQGFIKIVIYGLLTRNACAVTQACITSSLNTTCTQISKSIHDLLQTQPQIPSPIISFLRFQRGRVERREEGVGFA